MSDSPGLQSDGGARIVDAALFRFLVEMEVRKAQRLRYSVSIVCISTTHPSGELGSPSDLVDLLRPQIRATDAVAIWPPASLVVLLLDAETANLPLILRRLTAHLADGSWSAGGVCYPRAATAADELLRQAEDLMDRAREDADNHFYLAS